MALLVTLASKSTHYAEVVFKREIEVDGETEVETDFNYAYFQGEPSDEEVSRLLLEGWEEVERHVLATHGHVIMAEDYYSWSMDDEFILEDC